MPCTGLGTIPGGWRPCFRVGMGATACMPSRKQGIVRVAEEAVFPVFLPVGGRHSAFNIPGASVLVLLTHPLALPTVSEGWCAPAPPHRGWRYFCGVVSVCASCCAFCPSMVPGRFPWGAPCLCLFCPGATFCCLCPQMCGQMLPMSCRFRIFALVIKYIVL